MSMSETNQADGSPPHGGRIAPEQLETLLRLQRSLLEDIALEVDHRHSLDRVCHVAESFMDDAVAVVMLFGGRATRLEVLAAPGVGSETVGRLERFYPYAATGARTAADRPVFVSDTGEDARWQAAGDLVECLGIRSCWSAPVRDRGGVIGAIVVLGKRTGAPTELQRRVLDICAFVVGILLMRIDHDRELYRLAHHDPLTGLSNRTLLERSLRQAVDDARAGDTRLAVLFIDLDQFKNINDSLGHKAGDEVLIAVANRMQAALVRFRMLARMGGDEFVVVLDHEWLPGDLDGICNRLLATIAEPMTVEGVRLYVNASIGISIFPRDGDDAMSLLQNADAALFEAKSRGRNTYRFYEPQLRREALRKIEIDMGLRAAIEEDRLEYYYQPQIDTRNNDVVGVETLIRWQHPERGILEARDFIGLAEKSGVLNDVNTVLLVRAAQSVTGWWRDYHRRFRLIVNVSVGEISPGYAARLLRALEQAGLPPRYFELEIGSGEPMADDPVRVAELDALNAAGAVLTIDGFGGGQTSFRDLVELPFRRIKIDKRLIRDMNTPAAQVVVKSLVVLGEGIGVEVVAEGVESEQQSRMLAQFGCYVQQGRFHAPPRAASRGASFLGRRRPLDARKAAG